MADVSVSEEDLSCVSSQEKLLCILHQSELKQYCEQDEQLACSVCQTSKLHENHYFSPVDEAAQDRKVGYDEKMCTILLNANFRAGCSVSSMIVLTR